MRDPQVTTLGALEHMIGFHTIAPDCSPFVRTIMHTNCGVSRCDRPTQDTICSAHCDDLVSALKAISTGGVQRVRIHKTLQPMRYLIDPDTGENVTDPDTGRPILCPRTYSTREEIDHYPGLWEELEVTLTRQDKIGAGQVKVRGKGDSPAMFHDRASDVRSEVSTMLSDWMRVFMNANPHLRFNGRFRVPDFAYWMAKFPALLAGLRDSPAMLTDLTRAVRDITDTIDRAPDRVYLGICSAPTDLYPCDQDVWGMEGNTFASCRGCGTQHDVARRQAALLNAVRDQDATPTEIDRSFAGYVGMQIHASSIRTWARAGEIQPTGHTEDGYPRYNVGVVFDHAQTKAARQRKEAA